MGNIEILEDACAKLPHTTRKMFGGHGLFAPNGGMFSGIVTDDEIVLKLVDEAAKAELVALGGHPWVYRSGSSEMTMKDWIVVPDRFYDEPQTLAQWAKRAHSLVPGKVVAKSAKGTKDAKGPAPARKASANKAPARAEATTARHRDDEKRARPAKRPQKAPAKKTATKKAPAKKSAKKR